MTEKEELEKGVMESKHRQIIKSVNDYLDMLGERTYARLLFSMRADSLFFGSVAAYMALVLLMSYLDTPVTMADICRQLMQLIEFLTLGRSWMHTRSWSDSNAELRGAVHVLVLIGMLPPGEAQRRRQKRPLWIKGIELVAKWKRQTKNKGALAPA